MSNIEETFFIHTVPPLDFDEIINEYYCWDESGEDDILLQDLNTMLYVDIEESNESLTMEYNQDDSIMIDHRIHLDNKEFDPFHIKSVPRHLRKRYQCNICLKLYANPRTLSRHTQRHKKYMCDVCCEEFNAKSHKNRHMSQYHEKTVCCDFCTSKFYTIPLLAAHFEMKHKKELIAEEQEENIIEQMENTMEQKKNTMEQKENTMEQKENNMDQKGNLCESRIALGAELKTPFPSCFVKQPLTAQIILIKT